MRDIKFRGKRVDNGEWVYGCLSSYYNLFFIGIESEPETYREGVWKPTIVWYEVIPESVGQYIGLNDKNGKEIYEGDIDGSFSEYWEDRLIVAWSKKEAAFGLAISGDSIVDICTDWDEIKVIGNIYDNHELIKNS